MQNHLQFSWLVTRYPSACYQTGEVQEWFNWVAWKAAVGE
jgi:hypothetical protein